MNNPYLARVDWTAMSTATAFGISFVVTILAACLLPRVFPRFRRPEVSFWVMLGIFDARHLYGDVPGQCLNTDAASGPQQERGGRPSYSRPFSLPSLLCRLANRTLETRQNQ